MLHPLLRRVLLAIICAVSFYASSQAQVVINEFNTGTPDYLELRNQGSTSLDISGWVVQTWYATSSSVTDLTPEPPFTMPVGTILASNGYLVLQESGTAGEPGTLPNSIRTGFNYYWTNTRTVEAALYDASGRGKDYVYLNWFGNPTAPHLPPGQNWIGQLNTGTGDDVRRIQDPDTDHASDWEKADSAGTPGGANPGQNSCNFLSLYGSGCPGTSGFTPITSSSSCPTEGEQIAITISNALGGTLAYVFFSNQEAANPIFGSGCLLNLVPLPGLSVVVPVGGYGPGGGTVTLLAIAPAGLSDQQILMQSFVLDPEAEIGFSATSGVLLSFP